MLIVDIQTARSFQRSRKKVGQATIMWLKVAVIIAAALIQLSGRVSQIFYFYASDYCCICMLCVGHVQGSHGSLNTLAYSSI